MGLFTVTSGHWDVCQLYPNQRGLLRQGRELGSHKPLLLLHLLLTLSIMKPEGVCLCSSAAHWLKLLYFFQRTMTEAALISINSARNSCVGMEQYLWCLFPSLTFPLRLGYELVEPIATLRAKPGRKTILESLYVDDSPKMYLISYIQVPWGKEAHLWLCSTENSQAKS